MKRFGSAALLVGMTIGLFSACSSSPIYTAANSTQITFTETGATVGGVGAGCEINGTAVSIDKAGTYVFSGSCNDGSITVKKDVTDVTLVLDGLTLASRSTSPVTLNKGSQAQILAAENSTNAISDTAESNDENAAIKVKSSADLTLGGTGSLSVTGNAKNGIKGAAESSITIDSLALQIQAADDGLSCDDQLTIQGGALNIQASGDAVKASPDVDDATNPDTVSQGNITISGGKFTLTSNGDGIQADGALNISGGEFSITTNGGHETQLADTADSCKGLKAAKALTVSGGTFLFDTADDSLHTNGDLSVENGTMSISTGDDALHADNALIVGVANQDNAPTIQVAACYEGLEGTTVDVYSGDINITATDDAVNAANSDLGRQNDAYKIHIHGGNLYLCAGADGLDSNHDIIIDGGVTEVYGANSVGDCAIDYDGDFTINGGSIFGAGMTPTGGTQPYILVGDENPMSGGMGPGGGFQPPDMANGDFQPPDWSNGEMPTPPDWENGETTAPSNDENGETPRRGRGRRPDGEKLDGQPPDFGDGGTPPSMESSIGVKEGGEIVVQDENGTVLYDATAHSVMGNVIFSSPTLQTGQTYTVLVDGENVGSAEAKLGTKIERENTRNAANQTTPTAPTTETTTSQ